MSHMTLCYAWDLQTFPACHTDELFSSSRAAPWLHSAISHDTVPVLWILTGNMSKIMFQDSFLQQIPSCAHRPSLTVSDIHFALGISHFVFISSQLGEKATLIDIGGKRSLDYAFLNIIKYACLQYTLMHPPPIPNLRETLDNVEHSLRRFHEEEEG